MSQQRMSRRLYCYHLTESRFLLQRYVIDTLQSIRRKKGVKAMYMRVSLLVSVVLLLTVIAGCCNTIRFSDLSPGTRYEVGDVITTSGVDIVVEPFMWGNDNWTSDGRAEVDSRQYSGASGNDMNARNVNLNFTFDYPRSKISLKFADLGGNENIQVNDEFLNLNEIISLDGLILGGVTLSVSAVQEGTNWIGKLVLDGTIHSFSIGGQELWIDDVCYCDGLRGCF
ncbi:MAG: hypothetical protein GQ565_01300 [Candidatus Aegiribacteria sp.]|nr:hypothetical protein [Candidatus Aegiribacteria sp.]